MAAAAAAARSKWSQRRLNASPRRVVGRSAVLPGKGLARHELERRGSRLGSQGSWPLDWRAGSEVAAREPKSSRSGCLPPRSLGRPDRSSLPCQARRRPFPSPEPVPRTDALTSLWFRGRLKTRLSGLMPNTTSIDPLLVTEVLYSVHHGNNKAAFCSGFVIANKPSDGLEPSTPSLPWRFRGGIGAHDRA